MVFREKDHEVRPSHKKGPAFWHQEGPASRKSQEGARLLALGGTRIAGGT